ncbi:MAG: PadR family transcriptional regulator [Acidimicrobiales bacterium]|jgi:DNA-binding PadR family transcriptional regulator
MIDVMSLRHALLDALAGEPMSGYDLTRYFAASLSNVWPAQHSQIYPELAKLVAEGLIAQTDQGPRGRKVYSTTPAGVDALREWLRETSPDFGIRVEFVLRVFCFWVLPREESLDHLSRYRAEFVRHRDELVADIAEVDWGRSQSHRGARLTVEFGRRYYNDLIEWVDWTVAQIEAGALEPGGPLPGLTTGPSPRSRGA